MAKQRRNGAVGWLVILAFTLWWDATHLRNGETLSSAFARSVRHPVHRWPVTLAWTYLTAHLFGVIPRRFDPLHRLANALGDR